MCKSSHSQEWRQSHSRNCALRNLIPSWLVGLSRHTHWGPAASSKFSRYLSNSSVMLSSRRCDRDGENSVDSYIAENSQKDDLPNDYFAVYVWTICIVIINVHLTEFSGSSLSADAVAWQGRHAAAWQQYAYLTVLMRFCQVEVT